MESRIYTIMMCVKFGDDPISSLDYSFTGGVPLSLDVGFSRNFVMTRINVSKAALEKNMDFIICEGCFLRVHIFKI